jgi:hypothetical protein
MTKSIKLSTSEMVFFMAIIVEICYDLGMCSHLKAIAEIKSR